MAVIIKQSSLTIEDYLKQEEKAIDKSEWIQGKIIKMAGASANYNTLTGKLHALLLFALEDLNYSVFMSDMRLWIEESQSYVYPDVMVIQGEPEFTDSQQIAVTNPCFIAEILSPSTAGFDKSQKFTLYRSISQLQEYLLIDQKSYRVELYRKVGERQWLFTEFIGKDAIVELEIVNIQIALSELYKRVKFNE
ncbi:Uma2 family endonuclease [Spirulina subsalsa FACHB-351]|uniref:Uma2 family endonuclease n=1 Tax=Spirulina subsalsa FACHB-351 TaxID=234711 RepID=A0ABT3LBG6_9CYAN|nr:Uma2 family endonuclease [Spirulina subsalsa]MCW6038835.1 Uma2 family endonuclease [Spirulina subsalsa FACHB-351]